MQENETGDVLEAEVVQADVVSTEENKNDTEEIQNETVSVSEENEGISENAQNENAGAVEE